MTSNKDHFEEFAPHTLWKHRILKNYVETWGRKMLLRRDAGDTIRFVDACAGSGRDEVGNDGSPVQAARANAIAQAQISEMVKRPVKIHTVAIEKDPQRCQQLQNAVAEWEDRVDVRCGTLADCIDEFCDGIPTLFFIDPFGLEPLRADLVRQALAGDKNEVLALFNDEGALRLLGGTKNDEDIAAEVAVVKSQPSLFPEFTAQDTASAESKAEHKILHRAKTRPRAEAILTSTIGSEVWREIPLDASTRNRLRLLLGMYTQQLYSAGATHVVPMQILKADGLRAYKLIHATKSAKGYAAMKEEFCRALRSMVTEGILSQDLANEVYNEMRDPMPIEQIVEQLAKRYAGKDSVLWAESEPGVPSLKRDLLENTKMLPTQIEEVKKALKNFKDSGRKLAYSFPVKN